VQVVSQLDNIIREMMAQLAAKLATVVTTASAIFSDAIFFITGSSDATKKLAFDVDTNVTTATTRTLTVQDKSGTIGLIDAEDQTISGGAAITPKALTALSAAGSNTVTPDPGDRPIQTITNDHAGSILPGSTVGSYILIVSNATGAGAITTTGWTLKGDSFDTTTTSVFACFCVVTSAAKLMTVTKVA
jgi:hypothetical protein